MKGRFMRNTSRNTLGMTEAVGISRRAVFGNCHACNDLGALPEERLELSPGCPDGILNPARLPIPPLRQ